MHPRRLVLSVVLPCVACTGTFDTGPREVLTETTVALAPAPGLRTLSSSQYRASVRQVLGVDAPLAAVGQSHSSLAAARSGIASLTVLEYEAEAHAVTAWVFEDPDRRAEVLGCAPSHSTSDSCIRQSIERLGRRAFRRPLTPDELTRWASVAETIGQELSDPAQGLRYALAGLLQSPHFLYRVERGQPLPGNPQVRAYDDYEMASRLAFFLWGTSPNDALLDAAERGEFSNLETLRAQVEGMLADPRAQVGIEDFFGDLLNASAIDELDKDPELFPEATPEWMALLRAQMVRTAAASVRENDLRELFTSRTLFVNDELAAYYDFELPNSSELVPITLSGDHPRAGVLTTPGFLAHHAYPSKTSPALRGLFVRKAFLCQEIPPPPEGVETTLPEPVDGALVTTRDLVGVHQSEPACAGCHRLMDPIGFGLENFDALGGYRSTQNSLEIDASGELDGLAFGDAAGLGQAIADHPRVTPCLIENLYAYGAGHTAAAHEADVIDAIVESVVIEGHRIEAALRAIALSDAFRFAATTEEP